MGGRQTNSQRCAGGCLQLRSEGAGRSLYFTAENAEIAERHFYLLFSAPSAVKDLLFSWEKVYVGLNDYHGLNLGLMVDPAHDLILIIEVTTKKAR